MCLIIMIGWYHKVRDQCVDTYMVNFLLVKQRLVTRLREAEASW